MATSAQAAAKKFHEIAVALDNDTITDSKLCDAANMVAPPDLSSTIRPVKPKYRDPVSGALWSGRGKMPAWLQARVDAGETPADFLLK